MKIVVAAALLTLATGISRFQPKEVSSTIPMGQDGTFHGFLGRLSHLNVEPWSNWVTSAEESLKVLNKPKYLLGVQKWIWALLAAFLAASCFVGMAPILLSIVKRRRATTLD